MSEIPRGVPFHVQVAHSGVNALGVRLKLSGSSALMEEPIEAGEATFVFAQGIPAEGAYTLEARAFNQDGESTPLTEALTITAAVPTPPTSVTVLAQQGQVIPVTITVG